MRLTGNLVTEGHTLGRLAVKDNLLSNLLNTKLEKSRSAVLVALSESVKGLDVGLDELLQGFVVGSVGIGVTEGPLTGESAEGGLVGMLGGCRLRGRQGVEGRHHLGRR